MIMSNITTLLARRYVLSRRKGGFVSLVAWFSMLGIMLGVATLIIVTSLMNGIRQEMLANFIGVDGHIRVQVRDGVIPDYREVIDRLRVQAPGDAVMLPRIEGQVMVTGRGDATRGAQVVALLPEDVQKKPHLAEEVSEALEEGMVTGARLAEGLRLLPGDSITLISPQGRATAFGTVPRIKAYPVAGTFELGMHALDSSLILMPYDKALVYFALTRKGERPATAIEVTLTDSEAAADVAAALQQVMGDGYVVYPWQRVHQSVFNALEIQRNVMVLILALIIVVAAFNIISSLVMMVKDKRGDVAILRTMGMSRSGIIRLFVLTGMSIGIVGTLLGSMLGVLGAENLEPLRLFIESVTGQKILVANLYFLSTLPTQTDMAEVGVIVAMSLLLSFVATIYPAYKAASIDPAEALRDE